MRTATSCAPVTAPRLWPPYATWPSASSAWSTAPATASPQPQDPCHDAQNEPSSSSPNQASDPTLPTPWQFQDGVPHWARLGRVLPAGRPRPGLRRGPAQRGPADSGIVLSEATTTERSTVRICTSDQRPRRSVRGRLSWLLSCPCLRAG